MCGIVGFVNLGKTNSKMAAIMSDLLVIDSIRGYDSTGIFMAGTSKEGIRQSVVYKQALTGADFVTTVEFNKLRGLIGDADCMVGHNRWATVGHVTEENAHPFQAQHITMVHNGTLYNHKALTDDVFAVDSEGLCNFLAQDKTAQDIRDKVNGAYAMVWRDAKKHTLNFFRNYQRPLVFAHCDGFMLFASEQCMLEFVTNRHKIKVDRYEDLEAHTHVVIDLKTKERTEIETKYISTYTGGSGSKWKPSGVGTVPYQGNVMDAIPASAMCKLKKGERLTFMYLDHVPGADDTEVIIEGSLYPMHPDTDSVCIYATSTPAIVNNVMDRRLAMVGYIDSITEYQGQIMVSLASVAPSCYSDPEFLPGRVLKAVS